MFKVIGYKTIDKNGKVLVLLFCVRKASRSGEVGTVCETHFLPPYLVDKVDTYVGQLCKLDFHKFNDRYTLSNVTIIDVSELSALNVD